MAFCKRCFDKLAAQWAKKCNYDPKCHLDVKGMRFPCQIPIYDPDFNGVPRMRIFDCEKEANVYYTMEDYNLKRSQGLLP